MTVEDPAAPKVLVGAGTASTAPGSEAPPAAAAEAPGPTPAGTQVERDVPRRMTLVQVALAAIGALNVLLGFVSLSIASDDPEFAWLFQITGLASVIFGAAAVVIAAVLRRRDPRVWQGAMVTLVAWIIVSVVVLIVVVANDGAPSVGLALIVVALVVGWLRGEKSWWVPER
jgi:uncharacterized membrane protein